MASPHSSKSKAPAFQFYPSDFLGDANVIVMSLPERGAYITLLCICWQQGFLPTSMERLARSCGATVEEFLTIWPALAPCFRSHPSKPDCLFQPRLERERKKQAEFRQKQSNNGKKGGRPRLNPEESQTKATGLSQTKAKKSSLSPSLSPSLSLSPSSDSSQKIKSTRARACTYQGEHLTVTQRQHDWLCQELGPSAPYIDLLGSYAVWDAERGLDDTDTLAYLKRKATELLKGQRAGGPMYSEDFANWCHHDPPCDNRVYHDVILRREARAKQA